MSIVRVDKPTGFKPRTVICPKHGLRMRLRRTTKHTYEDGRPKWFYYCPRWPECTISVSAHPNGEPMGDPGDERTKAARVVLHSMFDPIWRSGAMTREEAYLWLSRVTGLPPELCHIGRFNEEMCLTVLHILRRIKEVRHGDREKGTVERRWRDFVTREAYDLRRDIDHGG